MSYEPTTWVNGDIITATKLNNIESGVQSVSSSYEPTTWVNGDIITAAKLNNIEQGIANAGGGGSSWTVLTEETVTTVEDVGDFSGALSYVFTEDPPAQLKITFNGTPYVCDVISIGSRSAYGGIGPSGPDFSQYPFGIFVRSGEAFLYTETAGTYTIKIEAPQSSSEGESSDFSTAVVTRSNIGSTDVTICLPYCYDSEYTEELGAYGYRTLYANDSPGTDLIILYKGQAFVHIPSGKSASTTGDIEFMYNLGTYNQYLVTGDCTITIS